MTIINLEGFFFFGGWGGVSEDILQVKFYNFKILCVQNLKKSLLQCQCPEKHQRKCIYFA